MGSKGVAATFDKAVTAADDDPLLLDGDFEEDEVASEIGLYSWFCPTAAQRRRRNASMHMRCAPTLRWVAPLFCSGLTALFITATLQVCSPVCTVGSLWHALLCVREGACRCVLTRRRRARILPLCG